MIDNSSQKTVTQEVDAVATLAAIKDAGWMVKGWCRRYGFAYHHLYLAVHGLRGGKRKSAPKVAEMMRQLEADGFLRFKSVSNG